MSYSVKDFEIPLVNDFIFKKDEDSLESQGSVEKFWPNFTIHLIKPEEVLSDRGQIKDVYKAMYIVRNFEAALFDKGLLETEYGDEDKRDD